MISHHPESSLLFDYATGAQREPLAVLIATHLALCPVCRATVAEFEAVGGDVMMALEPVSLEDDAAERALRVLDTRHDEDAPAVPRPAARPPMGNAKAPLPQPLSSYVGDGLERLRWKSRGGLSEAALLDGYPGFRTRLMRIRGGSVMPRHTHEGSELTLVLAGGFSDTDGHYLRGDVAAADRSVDHQPMADKGEDCLCLAVTDAPLRLTGPIGRYLNFLMRRWA